jgi:hypothetical protein
VAINLTNKDTAPEANGYAGNRYIFALLGRTKILGIGVVVILRCLADILVDFP